MASLALLLVGCSGSSDRDAEESPAGAAGPTAAAPDAQPVTVGGRPALAPCSLVTLDDVRAAFPATTGQAMRSQAFLGQDLPEETRTSVDTTPVLRASCRYELGDDSRTSVTVRSDQYVDRRVAARSFRFPLRIADGSAERVLRGGDLEDGPLGDKDEIVELFSLAAESVAAKRGGARLPGVDDRVLFNFDTADLVVMLDTAVVSLDVRRSSGPSPYADPQTKPTLRAVVALAEAMLARYDAGDVSDVRAPDVLPQLDGWAAFVEPCDLLGLGTLEALGDTLTLEPTVRSISRPVEPDRDAPGLTPTGRSVRAECTVQVDTNTPLLPENDDEVARWTVRAELLALPADLTAAEVVETTLVRTYLPMDQSDTATMADVQAQLPISELDLDDAEPGYLLDRSDDPTYADLTALVGVDRHVLTLQVHGAPSGSVFDRVAPTREQLDEVLGEVVAELIERS